MSSVPSPPADDRRGFLAGLAALVLGGFALLTPAASAVVALLDPLWQKKSGGGNKLRVTTAEIADKLRPNVPESFALTGTRSNAWNTLPNETVGNIFLIKDETGKLKAFQSICPHQGCSINFQAAQCKFYCPCHKANFEANGARIKGDAGPACRDLDTLDVEVRDGEVWVDYKTFRTGIDRKDEA